MTLTATEFTRRFLQHVLPNGFIKIRHYGLLCSRNIKTKLLKCMILTGSKPPKIKSKIPKKTRTCPHCGSIHIITFVIPNHLAASP